MQSAHWIALLKRLPPEAHNQMSVTTVGGTEVMIQSILMLEGECLILKGRLAACQDTGRLYYVPYDQIDYIGFIRSVSEEEFRAWYGEPTSPAAEPAPVETNGNGHGSGGRINTASRAALLDRVRARTTMSGTTTIPSSNIALPTPPPTST